MVFDVSLCFIMNETQVYAQHIEHVCSFIRVWLLEIILRILDI